MRITTIPVLAAVGLIFLAGCTPAQTPADPSHLPDSAPIATQTPTPASTPDTAADEFGEPVRTDRGNLVKEVGQLAGITLPDHDDAVAAQFVVTDIVVDQECSAEYAETPANGHFIGIHLNIETTPDLALDDVGTLSFAHWGWQGFDADGKRVNDPIGNALWCMSDADSLPADIGPGQSVSGWLVLDMPTTTGSVALTMGAANGWEWSY